MKTLESQPERTLIDLFSGGGLFSWGFTRSSCGGAAWRVTAALDHDAACCRSLAANFRSSRIVSADIALQDPNHWLAELRHEPGQIGLIHASPPCTEFSPVNQTRSKDDGIFRTVFRWVEVWRPAVVCLENVPAFRHVQGGSFHREVVAKLTSLGYRITDFTLQAAQFGVPQFRKRLFYLAYRSDFEIRPTAPTPTHPSGQDFVSVERAIGDLPSRLPGDDADWVVVDGTDSNDPALGAFGLPVVTNGHAARALNDVQIRRLKHLKPGQAWDALPDELQPNNGFRHCYGRLDPFQPAFTITTGVGAPSRGCFSHYSQDRLITFREAARLQSISDDYILVGSRGERARIIGNAVPPLLAEAIRKCVDTDLGHFF